MPLTCLSEQLPNIISSNLHTLLCSISQVEHSAIKGIKPYLTAPRARKQRCKERARREKSRFAAALGRFGGSQRRAALPTPPRYTRPLHPFCDVTLMVRPVIQFGNGGSCSCGVRFVEYAYFFLVSSGHRSHQVWSLFDSVCICDY